MASREYLVDVAAYQPSSMNAYHKAGAKGVLIKATEGTWYKSPVAGAQVKSAHKYHMFVHIFITLLLLVLRLAVLKLKLRFLWHGLNILASVKSAI